MKELFEVKNYFLFLGDAGSMEIIIILADHCAWLPGTLFRIGLGICISL